MQSTPLTPEYFIIPRASPVPVSHDSPQPLTTTKLFSVSGSACSGHFILLNHTIWSLLSHFFIEHSISKVPLCCSMCQYSFSGLNDIPLYEQMFCLSIYLLMDFCFSPHLLATGNNAAMNIHGHMFYRSPVFSSPGQIPRSGSAGSYDDFLFNFLGSCQRIQNFNNEVI